jgi:hypothetical protein
MQLQKSLVWGHQKTLHQLDLHVLPVGCQFLELRKVLRTVKDLQ